MSLLSLPNEILLNYIFSCKNITISDLYQLMISCRQLHDIIVQSDKLWMRKFSTRWPEMYNQLRGKEKFRWKNWVFSLKIIEEVKKAVTSLSSQCFPLGKLVTSLPTVEKWFEDKWYPIPLFAEDELYNLVFNEEIQNNLTLSYYANIALKKLGTCLQVPNLKIFMAKPESQQSLLEGAKLISKWFHFFDNPTKKLVDNVEQCLQEMVKRVKQLVKERNVIALEDILKCINHVLLVEMNLRVYTEEYSNDWNHEAASIHKVLDKRIGYPEVLCVIYLEVATRMGITCEPFYIDCSFCSEKLILRCRIEGSVGVFYNGVCGGRLCDLSSIHPSLIAKPAHSFEVLFGQMLEAVVVRDQRSFHRSNLRLLTAIRLVCALWPSKVNIVKNAKFCLDVDHEIEDAYRLLQTSNIDSNEPVLLDCVYKLSSQQAVIDAPKVARHRLPSIHYAVGLMTTFFLQTRSPNMCMSEHILHSVIISWDECFREEVSRRKWGLSFQPVTDGYSLNQPFYHIISYRSDRRKTNFYVPQVLLQLRHVGVLYQNHFVPAISLVCNLGIFFDRFDGRRYVPNAELKAHFPDDDAFALSLF